MVYCGTDTEKSQKKLRKEYKQRLPPKPAPRRRELSNPPKARSRLPFFGKSGQVTKQIDQTCTLFTRLPPEIRAMIFAEALEGHSVFHIVSLYRRVGHVRCSLAHGTDIERRCIYNRHNFFPIFSDKVGDINLSNINLGLLQTCRQMYCEAIKLLYSTNTFDFAHPENFTSFARTVRPQRLAAITSVQISWFTENFLPCRGSPGRSLSYTVDLEQDWDPTWDIIVNMQALKRLNVCFCGPQLDEWQYQDILLAPMARLRGLREFGLVVRKKTGIQMDQSTVVELSPFGIQVKQYAVTPRVEEDL